MVDMVVVGRVVDMVVGKVARMIVGNGVCSGVIVGSDMVGNW